MKNRALQTYARADVKHRNNILYCLGLSTNFVVDVPVIQNVFEIQSNI